MSLEKIQGLSMKTSGAAQEISAAVKFLTFFSMNQTSLANYSYHAGQC